MSLNTDEEINAADDDSGVDMIASGYDWECPACNHFNHEIEALEQVECKECKAKWKVFELHHAYP